MRPPINTPPSAPDVTDSPTALPVVRISVGLEAGLCECAHWARSINIKYLTNHHENCQRYNDSLMDVWKVTVDGRTAYCEHEQDARETAGDEQRDDITITKERMHREVFEHLPEFEGF